MRHRCFRRDRGRHHQIEDGGQSERRVAAVIVQRIVVTGVAVDAPHVVCRHGRAKSLLGDVLRCDLHDHGCQRGGHLLPQIQFQLCRLRVLLDLPDQRPGMIGRGCAHAVDVRVHHAHQARRKHCLHEVERRLHYELAGDVLGLECGHARPHDSPAAPQANRKNQVLWHRAGAIETPGRERRILSPCEVRVKLVLQRALHKKQAAAVNSPSKYALSSAPMARDCRALADAFQMIPDRTSPARMTLPAQFMLLGTAPRQRMRLEAVGDGGIQTIGAGRKSMCSITFRRRLCSSADARLNRARLWPSACASAVRVRRLRVPPLDALRWRAARRPTRHP